MLLFSDGSGMTFKLFSFIIGLFILCPHRWTFSQDIHPVVPKLGMKQGSLSTLPPSNSVSHIATHVGTLWTGTGKGLARSADGGQTWESFRDVPEFARPGIFAIALKGDTVLCSTGYSQEVNDQSVQTGTGYTYSLDNGATWFSAPQTLDEQDDSLVTYGTNTVYFLPVTVDEQNVTFDLALSDSFAWIASWSSGLRRSSDFGQTWERIVLPNDVLNSVSPGDSLGDYAVDPRENNNFLLFSVFVQNDSTIWAGSAGGINKSTDGGSSWTKFSTLNQGSPILGNWVISIKGQQIDSTYRLWITNWPADLGPNEQYGVSYSDDGGRIWKNLLQGVKAYDFAFKDSIVYIATDDGVYRTADGGKSWVLSGSIIDSRTGQQIVNRVFFSVGVIGDTVFCGGSEGVAKTLDYGATPFGQTWEVIRSYQPVGNSSATYAYPNPFSPDEEIVRVHYSTGGVPASVTIEVFDFGMNRVRTIIRNADRSGTTEYDEIWDGRDENARQVANGVYFYRVTTNDGEPSWGKIMVLQ